jgi:hypothetical protein
LRDFISFVIQTKNEQSPHLGRKLDDSLPDFEDVVVRGFWKWEKEVIMGRL